jgi:hypothetical protein
MLRDTLDNLHHLVPLTKPRDRVSSDHAETTRN